MCVNNFGFLKCDAKITQLLQKTCLFLQENV